jgi:cell division septation protein DedD
MMDEKEKALFSQKKSTQKQKRKVLIPWVGLTLFFCVWMFVLGILVGREMVPVRFDIEKLQNELAALKEAVIKKEMDQYKINSDTDESKTKLGFYETLKKTGSGAGLKDDTIENRQKSEPKEPEKIVSLQKDKMPIQETVPAPKEKTSDLKKTIQNKDTFTIQIASLKDSGIADNMVSRLIKEGYPAYQSVGKIPGKGIWHRVQVGYFNNRKEADPALQRLKKEKIDAIIVRHNIDSGIPDSKTKLVLYGTPKKTGDEAGLKNDATKRLKKPESTKLVSLQKERTPTPKTVPAPKEKALDSKKATQNNPPAVLKQERAGDKFTIQIASVKDSGIADKLVSRLKKGGYPAYRSIGKVPGKGIWYRVRVGYFNSKSEAGPTLNRLKKEKIEAVIVQP